MAFVKQLFAYPIKSLPGCSVDSLTIAEGGFLEDHRFVVVDRDGNFINPRRRGGELLLATRTKVEDDVLVITSPRVKGAFRLALSGNAGRLVAATVQGDRFEAEHQGRAAERWFSNLLGQPAMLVQMRNPRARTRCNPAVPDGKLFVNTADESPGHLFSGASLSEVNSRVSRIGLMINEEVFRPQVVLGGIAEAYYEDSFEELLIGDVLVRVSGQTLRCNVVDINPETGERNPNGRVLKLLSRPRPTSPRGKPFFGVYFWWPDSQFTKVIRVNDNVRILSLRG